MSHTELKKKATKKCSVFCLLSSVFCILYSVFCILFSPSPARANFDFNANCQQSMQAILDLRLKDARFLLEKEKDLHPENGYTLYLEHYAESIELIITEDYRIYEKLISSYEDRMDQMDRLDDGTPDNKWLQAEMLFHTGLAQVKFGTRLSGASKMLSSYRQTKAHRAKYPDFWQNRKLTGTFNIILDFIPPFMRWAADMFGFSGNAELGIYQLRQYCEEARNTPGLSEEAVLVTTLGYKLTWKEEEGFKFIESQEDELLNTTLIRYLYATAATYVYRNDLALALLAEIHHQELQVNFYSLNYITGRCKLNRLEPDAAIYLENYLDQYPGLDYKKDVCQRLSYFYLIHGDEMKYEEYRAKVALVGQDLRDSDQEALLESRQGTVPHVELLKARLLCDGGYFEDALGILKSIDPAKLDKVSYRLEYHYRLGRIMQLSGFANEAINELTISYTEGKSHPSTFATRSALYLGRIYEEKSDYATASSWYQRCISVYSSSHTTEGVKDMAAKGVKRLKP
jgi:hypothetical protein